ncbi:MAG: hypothetical protein U5Q44_03030 [Dehalococcoidia bacterium]|nr:hypothetical protein [Dehalococcoidia bacterium]
MASAPIGQEPIEAAHVRGEGAGMDAHLHELVERLAREGQRVG